MNRKDRDKNIENKRYRKIFTVIIIMIISASMLSYIYVIWITPSFRPEPPKFEISGTESLNITFSFIKIRDPDDLLRFHNVVLYIIDEGNIIIQSSFLDLLNSNGDVIYRDIDGDWRFSHFDYLIIGYKLKRPGLILRGIYTPLNSEVFNYVLG